MNVIMAGISNLAGPDMLLILFFVLLFFGSKKLPELARGMGRAVKEFTAAREEIERELTHSDSRQPPELKSPDVKMGIPAVGGILD
jgi:sec-independent protein translocase protein TatA